MHAVGTVLGEVKRQDAAHRKAARQDHVAVLLELVVRGFDTRVPLVPGGAAQFFGRTTVAGELAAVDGVAGAREALSDEPQLDRCAAEPVDQQDADTTAGNKHAAVFDFVFFFNCHCVTITTGSSFLVVWPGLWRTALTIHAKSR